MPAGETPRRTGRSVTVLSGGAFCVSDAGGDIRARAEEGLFYRDTRHLSKLVLRVNGESPDLNHTEVSGGDARFELSAADGLAITRRRAVGQPMKEEVRVMNRGDTALEAQVEFELDADFADLFEVRGWHVEDRPGEFVREVRENHLRFSYRRDGFQRGTVISADGNGEVEIGEEHIRFAARLEPGQEVSLRLTITLEEDGETVCGSEAGARRESAPTLATDWEPLARSWEQSVEDLESLSFRLGPDEPGEVLAAGVPWYMALFGRDSLIACYQIVHLFPELAKNTLKALARRQATRFDDFRDAEPGKILHELRFGELARFGESPESPYYGTVDATPLFLILLHELWRWTADDSFVREIEPPARHALEWMENHADSNGDGYLDYKRRSPKGLENQGWKDSSDSMLFQNGEQAEPPIAPCEAQGYLYDALKRSAELAERVWGDADLSRRLISQAEDLRERFDRDFWVPERGGYYALALDGDGEKVDSITSNMGHLLWSGIVPEERSKAIADRLMDDTLFGGWGVRTMAEGEGGYDPLSYHNGSVWPHDNSLTALGLYRYGHREETNRIAVAMIEAAERFDYRLPEVFAGHRREPDRPPIEYPTTCSPQAWAAGTVPLLVRIMLGLEPDPVNRRLLTNPVLPEEVSGLRVENVPAFGERWEASSNSL